MAHMIPGMQKTEQILIPVCDPFLTYTVFASDLGQNQLNVKIIFFAM
jgi:hypothetical protein